MIDKASLREPDFNALVVEARNTDNQLALDLLYTIWVFRDKYLEWAEVFDNAPRVANFTLEDPQ